MATLALPPELLFNAGLTERTLENAKVNIPNYGVYSPLCHVTLSKDQYNFLKIVNLFLKTAFTSSPSSGSLLHTGWGQLGDFWIHLLRKEHSKSFSLTWPGWSSDKIWWSYPYIWFITMQLQSAEQILVRWGLIRNAPPRILQPLHSYVFLKFYDILQNGHSRQRGRRMKRSSRRRWTRLRVRTSWKLSHMVQNIISYLGIPWRSIHTKFHQFWVRSFGSIM